jgi:hypothetical protein
MSTGLEYDVRVRHSTSASIARCRRVSFPLSFSASNSVSFNLVVFCGSLIFSCLILVSNVLAQNNGGSGGHGGGGSSGASFSGSHVASGGASFGFSGSPGSGSSSHGSGQNGSSSNHGSPHSPAGNSNGNHPRHHYPNYPDGGYAGPVLYAVPFPYVEDNSADYDDDADADSDTDDNDADYQGGPTIFDRRGSGAASYVPPVEDAPRPDASMHTDVADEKPQIPTLLVFKDGHTIEVSSYAIVGVTLFDLTPGHPRRVALADLDLYATQKQNDDRGVVFSLPVSIQAN